MPHVRLEGGSVDGLALHYVREGRGPAIVLLHGLGGFGESWRKTIDVLAESADVLAVDLPGYGLSAKPRARYDLEFFTRVQHGFLDATGVGHLSLVGHSLGGAVAVTYALTHPARVDRLALVSAVVPGFDYRPSWLYRMASVRGLAEAAALCARRPMYRAALARCFHVPMAREIDALVDWSYAARTCWDAKAAYLATLRDVRADLGAAPRRIAAWWARSGCPSCSCTAGRTRWWAPPIVRTWPRDFPAPPCAGWMPAGTSRRSSTPTP